MVWWLRFLSPKLMTQIPSQHPDGGRREQTPISCPLTATYVLPGYVPKCVDTQTQNKQMECFLKKNKYSIPNSRTH